MEEMKVERKTICEDHEWCVSKMEEDHGKTKGSIKSRPCWNEI